MEEQGGGVVGVGNLRKTLVDLQTSMSTSVDMNVVVLRCANVCGGGEVIVYCLEKAIFMIIMTDLICGRIWVNFTHIS